MAARLGLFQFASSASLKFGESTQVRPIDRTQIPSSSAMPIGGAGESEQHVKPMDYARVRQIVLDIEANLLALRFKKQLDVYRDNRETIVGCHLVAGVFVLAALSAFGAGRFVAGCVTLIAYAAISLIALPLLSRHNVRAWRSTALPLLVLLTHSDSLLDEKSLRRARTRNTAPVGSKNVDQIGNWLTARRLYARLPSTDGTRAVFVRTQLGDCVRRQLDGEAEFSRLLMPALA